MEWGENHLCCRAFSLIFKPSMEELKLGGNDERISPAKPSSNDEQSLTTGDAIFIIRGMPYLICTSVDHYRVVGIH